MPKQSKRDKPNWKKIKAEYLAGGTSYRKLCAKYGVPLSTLRRKAQAENWVQLQEQVEHKIDDSLVEKVVSRELEEAVDFDTLVDEMMLRVKIAIYNVDTSNAKAVNLLVGALKDLQKIKGLDRSDLDAAEQKARIKALEAKSEAQKDDADDRGLVIRIEGDPSE